MVAMSAFYTKKKKNEKKENCEWFSILMELKMSRFLWVLINRESQYDWWINENV